MLKIVNDLNVDKNNDVKDLSQTSLIQFFSLILF